jgi:hypothetical protein
MVGRIERVPLREVWKKEAKDFTNWLYENLEVLGEELDLDLTAVAKYGTLLTMLNNSKHQGNEKIMGKPVLD